MIESVWFRIKQYSPKWISFNNILKQKKIIKEFPFSPHLYILYVSLGHILDINGTAKNSLQSVQNNKENAREKWYSAQKTLTHGLI